MESSEVIRTQLKFLKFVLHMKTFLFVFICLLRIAGFMLQQLCYSPVHHKAWENVYLSLSPFFFFFQFLFISKELRFYVKIPRMGLREVPGLIPKHSRKKSFCWKLGLILFFKVAEQRGQHRYLLLNFSFFDSHTSYLKYFLFPVWCNYGSSRSWKDERAVCNNNGAVKKHSPE